MKTFRIPVEMEVLVTVDETKFDETFMREFRESFYQFETLEEHVEHLAQLEARSLLSETFVEGYGDTAEMGIIAEVDDRGHFEMSDPSETESSSMHVSLIKARREIAARAARKQTGERE